MVQRIVTAMVAIPAVVGILFVLGGRSFFCLVAGAAVIASGELLQMLLPECRVRDRLLGACATVAVLAGVASGIALAGSVCLAGAIGVVFMVYLLDRRDVRIFGHALGAQALTMVCCGVLPAFLVLLRARPEGAVLILLLLSVTWAGDSGAFFIGTWLGRHRLAPRISPAKTVEGAIGGMCAALCAAALFAPYVATLQGVGACVLLGALVNVMNQLGDLFESLLKRSCGVKDSGSLLPGHGGMLDRVDSLLFAAPLAFMLVIWMQP